MPKAPFDSSIKGIAASAKPINLTSHDSDSFQSLSDCHSTQICCFKSFQYFY